MPQPEPTHCPPGLAVPAARIDFQPEDRRWIADRIEEILATGQLTLGPWGAEFENEFAHLCGVEHAVAVNSGTAALEIALRAVGVAGRRVLVPANTFFATAAAVVHAGATPVFMDTDPATFGTAPEEIERRLDADTAAVIVVHIGGYVSPRMPEIQALLERRGVALVEDAAHAHGSSCGGTAAGAFGAVGAFSFYPTKVMTSGEGGMLVTNDADIAAEARIHRDQGKASFTQNAHTRMGYNWRMSEPNAIIGIRHLQRLADMIAARRRIAAIYDAGLLGLPGITTVIPAAAGPVCNYYKYLVRIDAGVDRRELKQTLKQRYGVSLSGEVYDTPLHLQPVFERYHQHPLQQAEQICARHVCLPVFASMSDAQAEHVVSAFTDVLNG